MAFDFANFADPNLDDEYVEYLLNLHSDRVRHYSRLWDYFRNPLIPAAGLAGGVLNASSKPYFQAQEVGLPARITGRGMGHNGEENVTDLRRKEVVIENDIAWRVQTAIDFLFSKAPVIRSRAGSEELASLIEQVISVFCDANGGLAFLQEIALLGGVYGFVDVAIRTQGNSPAGLPRINNLSGNSEESSGNQPIALDKGAAYPLQDGSQDPHIARSKQHGQRAIEYARILQLETVEAARVLPILEEDDYRHVRYWIQRYEKRLPRMSLSRPVRVRFPWSRQPNTKVEEVEIVEILSPSWWQRYQDRQLIAEGPNPLGRVPVVHIQNLPLPGSYEGLGEVEPLIPLQDELNTRLSDRANRVTYQSFKMYLGKGIDDFLDRPVGPGQMWATANLNASIEEFGSDSGSPSEDAHIDQIRQAMDKVSGVSPLAAGLISGNVGNLTSATALRIVLSGLLARTAKKRLSYGAGLEQIIGIALDWLDRIGVLRTEPADRRVEIHWPDPLPADEGEALRNAQMKASLGVPTDRILAELGYSRASESE